LDDYTRASHSRTLKMGAHPEVTAQLEQHLAWRATAPLEETDLDTLEKKYLVNNTLKQSRIGSWKN
jgi:hypothetical protein